MKSPLLKHIQQIDKSEGIKLNRKAVTFLACLAISSLLWVVQTLSKTYTLSIFIPVTYTHLPENKVVENHLPKNMELLVNTTGFKYLIYKITGTKQPVEIDVKKLKRLRKANQYYFLPNSKIEQITAQLNQGMPVLKVLPDTVFINFSKKISRKVPIRVHTSFSFNNGHKATDSLQLNPAYVTVSGTQEQIEKIKFIETETLKIENIKENINTNISLKTTESFPAIEYSVNETNARMTVVKYTEGSMELPIVFKNVPARYSIKTFPDKVTVKYTVSLNDYEKIKPSDFVAFVDFKDIKKKSNKLKVVLGQLPKSISSAKIYPEKVEFIIRK